MLPADGHVWRPGHQEPLSIPAAPSLTGACRPGAGLRRLLSIGLEFKHIFPTRPLDGGRQTPGGGTGLSLQISLVNSPGRAGRANTEPVLTRQPISPAASSGEGRTHVVAKDIGDRPGSQAGAVPSHPPQSTGNSQRRHRPTWQCLPRAWHGLGTVLGRGV